MLVCVYTQLRARLKCTLPVYMAIRSHMRSPGVAIAAVVNVDAKLSGGGVLSIELRYSVYEYLLVPLIITQ